MRNNRETDTRSMAYVSPNNATPWGKTYRGHAVDLDGADSRGDASEAVVGDDGAELGRGGVVLGSEVAGELQLSAVIPVQGAVRLGGCVFAGRGEW